MDRGLHIHRDLAVLRVGIRKLRQLIQCLQSERTQKALSCPVKNWPPRNGKTSALFNQPPVTEQTDGVRGVHTADLLHIGLRGRLKIGNNRQRLQRSLRKLRRAAGLHGSPNPIRIFRRRGQLDAVINPKQPDAPALIAVKICKAVDHRLQRILIQFKRKRKPFQRHWLA